MRIFLTGATGYIGAAVLDALVRGGHDVTALVRNTEKARRVAKRGGHPVIGDLADPESYRAAAAAQDGYIHAAFDARPERTATIDRLVVDTILEAARLEGFAFDVELLFLADRAGLRIREVPVRWNHAEGSKVSFLRDSLRMLREVIALRVRA